MDWIRYCFTGMFDSLQHKALLNNTRLAGVNRPFFFPSFIIFICVLFFSGCVLQNKPGATPDQVTQIYPGGGTEINVLPHPTLTPPVSNSHAMWTAVSMDSGNTVTQIPGLTLTPVIRNTITSTIIPDLNNLLPTISVMPANPEEIAGEGQGIIFLQAGHLWWWDYRTQRKILVDNEAETAVDPEDSAQLPAVGQIVDFIIDQANSHIIFMRTTGVTANAKELFALEMKDMISKESWVLVKDITRWSDWQLSPDATWMTYRSEHENGAINLTAIEKTGINRTLNLCTETEGNICSDILWSPDGNLLTWGDNQGLWSAGPSSFEPQHILSNTLEFNDQSGELITLSVHYQPLAWSPHLRYLLVSVHPTRQAAVSWIGLVDLSLARIVEVPGTYQYQAPGGVAGWDPEGRLLVSRSELTNQIILEVWNILPTRQDLCLLDERFEIDLSDILSISGAGTSQVNYFPTTLRALDSRRMVVTLDDSNQLGYSLLLVVDREYRQVSWSHPIPYDVQTLLWARNKTGLLLQTTHKGFFYLSSTRDELYDLMPLLGDSMEKVEWLQVSPELVPEIEFD